MREITLNKRLKDLYDLLPDEKINTLLDLGTDHGYFPIFCLLKNKVDIAFCSDISDESLDKARILAKNENLTDRTVFRTGDGLKVLKKDEKIDVIVISGMGGKLISDILDEGIDYIERNKSLMILQPAQAPEKLREYLYSKEYYILKEIMTYDSGKFYQSFLCTKNKFGSKNTPLAEYMLSSSIIKNSKNTVVQFCDLKIKTITQILNTNFKYNKEHFAYRMLNRRLYLYKEIKKNVTSKSD